MKNVRKEHYEVSNKLVYNFGNEYYLKRQSFFEKEKKLMLQNIKNTYANSKINENTNPLLVGLFFTIIDNYRSFQGKYEGNYTKDEIDYAYEAALIECSRNQIRIHTDQNTKLIPAPKSVMIGKEDFIEMAIGPSFVDKSLFIKEILECDYQTLLIHRPRRWGKSMNMSMLNYFLEVHQNKENNSKVNLAFKELKIFNTIDIKEVTERLLFLNSIKNLKKFREMFDELVPKTCDEYSSILQKFTSKVDLTKNEEIFLIMKAEEYLKRLKLYFANIQDLDILLMRYIAKQENIEECIPIFQNLKKKIEIECDRDEELRQKSR